MPHPFSRFLRHAGGFAVALLFALATLSPAQRNRETQAQPGQFDFYLLNLSWSPEFCASETARHASNIPQQECGTPHGFILHGLWPQNTDGTYPSHCSNAPAPANLSRYLDITPDLGLLQHEWTTHGTCSGLPGETFFSTAREAYTSVTIPPVFQNLAKPLAMPPADILNLFYRANPSFPQGSLLLSCGNNRLTAIEACFSKDSIKPIACPAMHSCGANSVQVTPEITDSIVQ